MWTGRAPFKEAFVSVKSFSRALIQGIFVLQAAAGEGGWDLQRHGIV
jgi:hypothetical protein